MRHVALDDVENQPEHRIAASRLVAGVAAAMAALVVSASTAWSCVAMASLDLTPSVIQPGQEVEFGGSYYHDVAPVVLHWDSLDGPVLATVAPESLIDFAHGYRRSIDGRFTVPSDATPGAHVIVAAQEGAAGRPTWGVPARAVVEVGAPSPPPADGGSGAPLARLARLRLAHGGPGGAQPAALVGVASCVLTLAVAAALLRMRARPPSR